MKLKLLSWNIWCDGHMEEIAQFLGAADADIICLQEVVPEDKTRDVIGYLTGRGYHHAYAEALKLSNSGWGMGNAIFSKFPLTNVATHMLSAMDSRNAISADISVGGTTLHIFGTHLLHTHQQPSETQELQADTLIKAIPADHAIVAGDFNATPDSVAIQKMRAAMTDADPADTPTWCLYPEGCPVCKLQKVDTRLDYIFTSKDIVTRSFTVGDAKGSDHLPISVIVEL